MSPRTPPPRPESAEDIDIPFSDLDLGEDDFTDSAEDESAALPADLAEIEAELHAELDEDREDWARSSEGGWYYADDDAPDT